MIVTDNGGPFTSDRFTRFIACHPALDQVRTKACRPGQNGVRERAFGSLTCERLYREDITDGTWLAEHAHAYRFEFNAVRTHEALSWNRPREVHLGHASPSTPKLSRPRNPAITLTRGMNAAANGYDHDVAFPLIERTIDIAVRDGGAARLRRYGLSYRPNCDGDGLLGRGRA